MEDVRHSCWPRLAAATPENARVRVERKHPGHYPAFFSMDLVAVRVLATASRKKKKFEWRVTLSETGSQHLFATEPPAHSPTTAQASSCVRSNVPTLSSALFSSRGDVCARCTRSLRCQGAAVPQGGSRPASGALQRIRMLCLCWVANVKKNTNEDHACSPTWALQQKTLASVGTARLSQEARSTVREGSLTAHARAGSLLGGSSAKSLWRSCLFTRVANAAAQTLLSVCLMLCLPLLMAEPVLELGASPQKSPQNL